MSYYDYTHFNMFWNFIIHHHKIRIFPRIKLANARREIYKHAALDVVNPYTLIFISITKERCTRLFLSADVVPSKQLNSVEYL